MRNTARIVAVALVWLSGGMLSAGEPATLTEWQLPTTGRGPAFLAADGQGGFWFTQQDAARLAHFDPGTGTLTEWQDPSPFLDFGISVDDAGFVWIAVWSRALLRFDPASGRFDTFDIPGAFPLPFMVHVAGRVCTTQIRRNVVGCLDPPALQWMEWHLPPALSGLEGLTTTADGTLWIGANESRRIGRLDPASGLLTTWKIPGTGALRLQITSDELGRIWFPLFESGEVGRLDPETHQVVLYPLPNPLAEPFAVEVDPLGRLWMTESGIAANAIARLDPWAEDGIVVQIVPDTITLTARTSPSRRLTWGTEEPVTVLLDAVTTLVESDTTGGFHEWALPTPAAGPAGLGLGSRDRVFVLEYDADALAVLSLDPEARVDGILDALDRMARLLTGTAAADGHGLVDKLQKIAAIVAEASTGFAQDSVSIDDYRKRLFTVLQLLRAFERQLQAKVANGQIPEPEALELAALVVGLEHSIAGLAPNL